MDEEQLRLEYWEDTRSDPAYPLWVIFRLIGHQSDSFDSLPYLRHSQRALPEILKALETHPQIETIAQDIHVSADELHACLWYAIWKIEHLTPPLDSQAWDHRVDQAWRDGILSLKNKRSPESNDL